MKQNLFYIFYYLYLVFNICSQITEISIQNEFGFWDLSSTKSLYKMICLKKYPFAIQLLLFFFLTNCIQRIKYINIKF